MVPAPTEFQSSFPRGRCVRLTATLALLPVSLVAQVAPPDTTGRRDSLAVRQPQRLPRVTIPGSMQPLAAPAVVSGAGGTSHVWSREALLTWTPRHAGEALSDAAGLFSYDDLGSPWKPTLQLRGFTLSPVVGVPQGVTVFVDGIPMNEPDAAQVNLELLPLSHVAEVELMPGTSAVMGPNSLGGAINLVTRRGGSHPRGEIAVDVGRFGQRSVRASVAAPWGGFRWYVGGSAQREEGWRQQTGAAQRDALLSVERTSSNESRGLRMVLMTARVRAQTAGSLPFSVYPVTPDSNLTAGDFEALDHTQWTSHAWREVGSGRMSARSFVRVHGAERFNVNQINDPDVRNVSRNAIGGARLDYTVQRTKGNTALSAHVSGGAQWSTAVIRLLAERVDPGLTTHVQSDPRRFDALGTLRAVRGAWALDAGARWDHVRVPFRNRLNATRDTVNVFHMLNPHLGITWLPRAALSTTVSVARSFRTPALIELACADPEEPCPLPFALGDDPPLDPVVVTTAEWSTSYVGARTRWRTTLFGAQVRNDIYLHPYTGDEPDGSTIDGYFANIPRTQRMGVELTASTRFAQWQVGVEAQALRAVFAAPASLFSIRTELADTHDDMADASNDAVAGDRLPLVPSYTALAFVDGPVARRISARLAVRLIGRRWLRGDEANETTPLAPIATADAGLSWMRGPWQMTVNARNVTGRRYPTFGTFNLNQTAGRVERFLTPAAPRVLLIGITRQWGPRREP